eukprot:861816-Amphidinium_carterae.1
MSPQEHGKGRVDPKSNSHPWSMSQAMSLPAVDGFGTKQPRVNLTLLCPCLRACVSACVPLYLRASVCLRASPCLRASLCVSVCLRVS